VPPSQPGIRWGSNAVPVPNQCQSSAEPVRFPAARAPLAVLVAGERAVRLAASPAAPVTAFLAGRASVCDPRLARAGAALAAARQAGLHNLITYFPSVQVNPPFRGAKVRSATAPGTIGTGNL